MWLQSHEAQRIKSDERIKAINKNSKGLSQHGDHITHCLLPQKDITMK